MEEITAFKTSDGKVYEDKNHAEWMQVKIEFRNWYIHNTISDERNASIVLDWIIDNSERVQELLQTFRKAKDILNSMT